MKKQKGFTLIELLVVVAVIAILASVVLVNLRGARDKATDSRIISAMGQVRTTAEIIYSSSSTGYTGVCGTATGTFGTGEQLPALQKEITDNNGVITCHADNDNYCVVASLKETGKYWCVDGKGISQPMTTNPCTSSSKACS